MDLSIIKKIPNKSFEVTLNKFQQEEYLQNQDINYYTENILLLAKITKNKDLIEASKYCLEELDKCGYLTEDIKEIQDLILSKIRLIKNMKESQILSFKDFVNEKKFIPNVNIEKEDDVFKNDENFKFEDRKSTGAKFCHVVKDKNHSSFTLYLSQDKVGLEYYSGKNYTVGSYARSHSRRFDVKDIPKTYENQFKEMVKAFEYHFKIDLSKYDSNINKYYDEIKEKYSTTSNEYEATYGRSKNSCVIYTYDGWYAVENSTNINYAGSNFEFYDGIDIEEIEDSDTFQSNKPIKSVDDLIEEVDDYEK